MDPSGLQIMEKSELERLVQRLRADGYRVVGPTARDGAIVLDEIRSAEQLPRGTTHVTEAGHYRLSTARDHDYFNFTVGPHSWKKYLFPPRMKLFSITRNGAEIPQVNAELPAAPRYAFLGARACDLAALAIQDRVFNGDAADRYYAAVRGEALIVAVNCTEPAGTCFCTSMDTGPRCRGGYDLALTELSESFAIEAGSERGRELLTSLHTSPADTNTCRLVDFMMQSAAEHMGRRLDTADLPEILLSGLEHPHWAKVAERCLACANCTLACPTCFCSSVEDVSDLSGDHAERWRSWGSCFTLEFSYHTGGFARSSVRARYRQWLVHKLAGWHEQFGTSGCVGCGRCIAWCPVGIDITAEAATIVDDVRRSEKFSLAPASQGGASPSREGTATVRKAERPLTEAAR